MKKLFTFFLSAMMCTMVMAQRPEATIAKVGDVPPTIDGVIDDVWADVEKHDIDKAFNGEAPTVGDPGTTFWKALWADDGMYVLVVVNDDEWDPAYTNPAAASWTFDKIELYFDTNPILNDGLGGNSSQSAAVTSGNYQIAPDPVEANIDGTPVQTVYKGGEYTWSLKVFDGKNYNVEAFIPWTSIPDLNGNEFDKGAILGFDVTVCDQDIATAKRDRAVWANVGALGESWTNMDDIGYLTLDGASSILIDAISISADKTTLDTDNATAQITYDVTPADYTQAIKWNVSDPKIVSVSADGLVTAKRDGTVTISCSSVDDYINSNVITITVSNQIITEAEINLLKNGDFSDGTNGWGVSKGPGTGTVVEDGWAKMNMELSTKDPMQRWDISLSQGFPVIDATTVYKLKFTAKASADMSIDFIIEDTANSYPKDANCTESNTPELLGLSDWQLPLTTEAKTYTQIITFPSWGTKAKPSTYSLGFQGALHVGDFYVDNVILYSEVDEALLTPTSTTSLSKNTMSVYPNPVGSAKKLTVSLTEAKGKVAIYNALGQKMVEKVATSNIVEFKEVANFRQGMYFVKLSDGSTQKFIR